MVHNAAETLNASSQSLDSEPGEPKLEKNFFMFLFWSPMSNTTDILLYSFFYHINHSQT